MKITGPKLWWCPPPLNTPPTQTNRNGPSAARSGRTSGTQRMSGPRSQGTGSGGKRRGVQPARNQIPPLAINDSGSEADEDLLKDGRDHDNLENLLDGLHINGNSQGRDDFQNAFPVHSDEDTKRE